MQRPADLPAGDLSLGLARLGARQVGRHRDESVQIAVQCLDAREAGVGQLHRGDGARLDQLRELEDRLVEDVVGEHRRPS